MNGQLALFEEFTPPPIPAIHGRTRVGVREHSNALSKTWAEWVGSDYTLNPYVGCGFGCSYCYAASYVADQDQRLDWGHWVDVKIDAERQIAKADLKGKKVFMSSATDPYQPLEMKVQLTRRLVELMSDPIRQPKLRVQTRSPIAARDIDLFKRFESIRVNMSITTDSDAIRKRFEPGCASIDRRIEAITEIGAAGIPVGISIAPTLPIEDPEKFAKRLLKIGPVSCFTAYFHITKREFVANTRDPALELAKEYGWDEKEYQKTVEVLIKHLPMLR